MYQAILKVEQQNKCLENTVLREEEDSFMPKQALIQVTYMRNLKEMMSQRMAYMAAYIVEIRRKTRNSGN